MTEHGGGADRLRPYMHRADPPAGPLPVPYDLDGTVVDGESVENDLYGNDQYGDEPPDASRLRPYQMTGGRTAPVDPTLAIESQVVIPFITGSNRSLCSSMIACSFRVATMMSARAGFSPAFPYAFAAVRYAWAKVVSSLIASSRSGIALA